MCMPVTRRRAWACRWRKLIVASNRNDILTRFFETGTLSTAAVQPTLSPSMDIQISSNFERLLYDLYDGDAKALAAAMAEFRKTGRLTLGAGRWQTALRLFDGARADDEATLAEMARIHRDHGMLVDPHTAVGIAAARAKIAAGALADDGYAGHRPGHRASGEVPRCGGARHRHSPGLAGPSGGSAHARGTGEHLAQRGWPGARVCPRPCPTSRGPRRPIPIDGGGMTIEVTRLPNGLTIASDHMPTVETVSRGHLGWCRHPARTAPAINGVAHLLEHMAFKGTARRSRL